MLSMDEAKSTISNIKTKDDFISFVQLLQEDLKDNPRSWENNTLESYLEAMTSWTESIEQYYINTAQPVPDNISWRVFADILMASTMYE